MDVDMRLAVLTLVCAFAVFAGEFAVLTSGARLHADRHEAVEFGKVRLFNGTGAYTELPASLISHYEVEEPKPQPAAVEVPAPPPTVVPAPTKDPRQLVDEAADRYGLPRQLVHSLVKTESAYQPKAISPKGAIGLMQLMPGTAKLLGVDPHDPVQNVDAGARHLRDLLLKYDGGLYRALAAYNAGAGAVEKYRGVPPYRETVLYIQKIVRASGLGAGN
jgi:soluble lytic murein transglycosylase-like protein